MQIIGNKQGSTIVIIIKKKTKMRKLSIIRLYLDELIKVIKKYKNAKLSLVDVICSKIDNKKSRISKNRLAKYMIS